MKKNNINFISILYLISALLLSTAAMSDEQADRRATRAKVKAALNEGNYAKLEMLSNEYRNAKTRTGSGTWKIDGFYWGIKEAVYADFRDEAAWKKANAKIDKWLEAYPKSVSAHSARIDMMVKRAWQYRGEKYVKDTPREGLEKFRMLMKEAVDYSKKHYGFLAKKDPYFWRAILHTRPGSGNMKNFMPHALKYFPNYYGTVFEATFYSLPRWGGSYDDIEALANSAVKASYATEGNSMYARTYWFLSEKIGDHIFTNQQATKLNWNKMKAGMIDVLERYPDDWNIDNFVRMSCRAGDAETVMLLLRYKKIPPTEDFKQRVRTECTLAEQRKRAKK